MAELSKKKKALAMLALVVAGEAIFFLPFILPRVFRPTLLDVFQINNLQLGTMFSAYGVVAMVSYFLGGPLADRFPARSLMAVALAVTALGGFIMLTLPSYGLLIAIYAFWGFSTILLFWAALIRATREWGSNDVQGKAFGLLDAGRGLSGALISTVGLTVLGSLMPAPTEAIADPSSSSSFQLVIGIFSFFTLLVALLVWFALPSSSSSSSKRNHNVDFQTVMNVLEMRKIWLHSLILLCAYVGYKVTDDFSLYAKDVLGYDQVKAAGVGTLAMWLRPIVAIIAGFMADRFLASRITTISFGLVLFGGVLTWTGIIPPSAVIIYLFTLLTLSAGVYSLRVLYYAILEEAGYPLALTGTVVGIISVVGYTPDIFVGPMMGVLLDNNPGPAGHQYLFLVLSGFAFVGLIASLFFKKMISPNP